MASLPEVHGVAPDPLAYRGYTTNGGDSSISVFDTQSLRVSGRIRLKTDTPDGIVFDPATRRVFAMHDGTP
jgi:DNA-binding beta-propeller fold protein YncE